MKVYVSLIILMTTSLYANEDVNPSEDNNAVLRLKRSPKITKIVHIYAPLSRRRLKPGYWSPKPLYGPPNFYSPPKSFYGPPNFIHSSPKPIYGPPDFAYGPPNPTYALSKPPKINYGLPLSFYKSPENFFAQSSFNSPPHPLYEGPNHVYNTPQDSYGSFVPLLQSPGLPQHSYHPQYQQNYASQSYSDTYNCGNYDHGFSNHIHNHAQSYEASTPHSPGYEPPPLESASVPLNHEPPKASYGTPNAVTSYGTPVHSGFHESNNLQFSNFGSNSWHEDVLGSSSNIIEYSVGEDSTSLVTNPSRGLKKTKKNMVAGVKSPNHNYEGKGVEEDDVI